MVSWTQDSTSRDTIRAELSGAAGISTFPSAAAPADGVSLTEVIRQLFAALQGTAAGENGIGTWPTSAAYGNNVSIAEVLGYLQDSILSKSGVYVPGFGFKVSKTENINTATGVDLFTVTGKVLLTMWTGEVTNALGAAVTDYKLRIKTDNVDLCAATNIASAAVGYMFSLCGDAGLTLLTGSSYAVSAVKTADMNGLGFANRIVGLASGSCTLQSLRTAGDASDSITHSIWYLPLEASATVAAA
jgi:hypothetical protein